VFTPELAGPLKSSLKIVVHPAGGGGTAALTSWPTTIHPTNSVTTAANVVAIHVDLMPCLAMTAFPTVDIRAVAGAADPAFVRALSPSF
jgi:hypothetical protein